jgi:hypothetical protein
MRSITLASIAILAAVLALQGAPAQAQTWVSGGGSNVGTCPRSAPCATYTYAFSQANTGGEIFCLDPGNFGELLITKSISVVCDHTVGNVSATDSSGFVINAPAGSTVTLKGQYIGCRVTTASGGFAGISIFGAGVTVHIEKVHIKNCRFDPVIPINGIAIKNSSGVATVLIDDSAIIDSGSGTNEAGILIRPTGGASANVSVTRTRLKGNSNGIFADGSGSGGPSNISVKDSVLNASTNAGIAVSSSGGAFSAVVDNTLINFNAGFGAAVAGAPASLRIAGSTITQNITGLGNFGGTLQSLKNNFIAGNGTDGTPVPAFPGPGETPLQ